MQSSVKSVHHKFHDQSSPRTGQPTPCSSSIRLRDAYLTQPAPIGKLGEIQSGGISMDRGDASRTASLGASAPWLRSRRRSCLLSLAQSYGPSALAGNRTSPGYHMKLPRLFAPHTLMPSLHGIRPMLLVRIFRKATVGTLTRSLSSLGHNITIHGEGLKPVGLRGAHVFLRAGKGWEDKDLTRNVGVAAPPTPSIPTECLHVGDDHTSSRLRKIEIPCLMRNPSLDRSLLL